MALGKKNNPDGYFEKGDLLYVKPAYISNTPIYAQPKLTSEQYFLTESDGLLGVILDENTDTEETGIWLQIKTNTNKLGYLPLDSFMLTSKANPEYNYPDVAKKEPFNWNTVFESISVLTGQVLGRLTAKNSTTNNTVDSGAVILPSQETKLTPMEWIIKNILLITILPLAILIIWLVLKKDKTPKVVPSPNPTPQA